VKANYESLFMPYEIKDIKMRRHPRKNLDNGKILYSMVLNLK